MFVKGASSLHLKMIKLTLQLQPRFDTFRQILLLQDLPQLPHRCFMRHMILVSCVKQDLIKPDAVRFILSQSSSVVDARFFSNRRVSSRFDAVSASITSHPHVPKLFLPSNFTTSIFKGCGFMNFTDDVLSSAIFSIDSLK